MKLFSSVLFAGLLLLGCGQKGPLYREPAPETNQTSQEQPAPGAKASQASDENSQNNSMK